MSCEGLGRIISSVCQVRKGISFKASRARLSEIGTTDLMVSLRHFLARRGTTREKIQAMPEGDFVGARERLRVLPPQLFEVKNGEVACKLSFAEFCCRPKIDPECWPDTTPETNAN